MQPVQRVRKPEPSGASDGDPSAEHRDGTADAAARVVAAAPEARLNHEPMPATREVGPAPHRPAEPPHTPPVRPTAAQTPARDIRLELVGTGRRVEVRLEERAGEVRVSVRTPDGTLADTLRDNLPALSSRLEQSGFRADQWHAADANGGMRPIEVLRAAGGGASEERQHQTANGGEQSPQEQSGRQREPRGEGSPNRNQKGKGFAWLMSALE